MGNQNLNDSIKFVNVKASPQARIPLICSRIVQTTARSFPIIAGLSDAISFTTRTGTREGVTQLQLKCSTHRELASWVKSIIENTYKSCADIEQTSSTCLWQEKQCELLINLNDGISLIDVESGTSVWHYRFEEIRASGDYNNRYLWLDFGPSSKEQEIEMLDGPKVTVFILHTFLSTKVHSFGLYA